MTRVDLLLPWMTEHRRHLHAYPEVGLELPQTHAYLEAELAKMGLAPEVHPAAGLSVRLPGTSGSGQVRVLRVDMDALPLQEQTNLPYASKTDGSMHACGHDLHMAMLLGAARILVDQPARHDVVLAFQPGEEADRGALRTLRHANLDLAEGTAAFALHVNAMLPPHSINYRSGTFMANGDWFALSYKGAGGHASMPEATGNPADAAGLFVHDLRDAVAELATDEHVVATVTEIHTGSAVNVIATDGILRGTLRTLSDRQRSRLHDALRRLAVSAGKAARVEADLTITDGYPAVIADEAYLAKLVAAVAGSPLAAHLTEMPRPSMVIEDFSYFLRRWPGAMVYLGSQVNGATAFNHSAHVQFDESVMVTGTQLYLLAAGLDV